MPPAGNASAVGSEADRALAREAVARSQVLLATTPGALPIDPSAGQVLLAGRGADDIGVQSGGWTITWQGSEGATTPGTTISEALAAELGDRLTVATDGAFAPGTHAPTGIVVVAEPPYAEGRGDSATLALPPADLEVRGAGPAARRPAHRGGHLRPAGDARRDPALRRRGHRGVAAGHGGAGRRRCPPGATPFTAVTPYTWPLTPSDAPRTGKGPCDGARYPAGYGLDATGGTLGPGPARRPERTPPVRSPGRAAGVGRAR